MKINLVEVPTPMFSEHTLMADINKELLTKEKKVIVSFNHYTKTRISTSMQIGQAKNGINFAVEGFKTFESREHSYFSDNINVSNYFVKSKKQDFEAYKEYVKKAVEIALTEYINIDIDEVTIELQVGGF